MFIHHALKKVVLSFLEYTLVCFLHSELIIQKIGRGMSCHATQRSIFSIGQPIAQLQGSGAFASSLQEMGTLGN